MALWSEQVQPGLFLLLYVCFQCCCRQNGAVFSFMLEELKHRKTKVLLPEESNPVSSQFQSSALILTRSGLPCATMSGTDLALRVRICEQAGCKRSRVVTVLLKHS